MSKPKAASKRWPVPPRTAAVLLVIALLVVVSTALASDGAMVRKNASRTPELETENAQISVGQFYVDAQRASGILVAEDPESDRERWRLTSSSSTIRTGNRSTAITR